MARRAMLALLLLPLAVTATEPAASIEFDISRVQPDRHTGGFSYDGLEQIPVGLNWRLPVKTVYVKIDYTGAEPRVTWQVTALSEIGAVDVEQARADIPTTDDPISAARARATRSHDALGREPVIVAGRIEQNGERWVKLAVFPVTVDSTGRCCFNQSLAIYLDSTSVDAQAVLDSSALPVSRSVRISLSEAELSAGGTTYLIVTSQLLAPSAARLAAYKNSTGIPTEVRLIDDILAVSDGRDDAERLREYLKEFYASGGRYVLLAGDETQLPVRYAYPYSVSAMPEVISMQICDLYFADLTGEWDVDNDNIWGERYDDQPDITPELMVGRLPFCLSAEVDAYIDKLIAYETDPGRGERDYLERGFFFCSDQMRDYPTGGQHGFVAAAYPQEWYVDTLNGIELASGGDLYPFNLPARDAELILNEGFGVVHIIAHGTAFSFEVRTSGYNDWPKSYFTTDTTLPWLGQAGRLAANGKTSLYYSLACDNGAFDLDQPPYNCANPNLVQVLLALPEAGAVAFVANSRWGWVSSSYLIEAAFFTSLFSQPGRPAVEALHDAKAAYAYYTDQVYGLNYHGDPTLKIHIGIPGTMQVSTELDGGQLVVLVSSDGVPVADSRVIISRDGETVTEDLTGHDGLARFNYDFALGVDYTISAVSPGYTITQVVYTPTITTDVEHNDIDLPSDYAVKQNYPNPFNPTTTIVYELPTSSSVRLSVHNALGQLVVVLREGLQSAGVHQVEWNGRDRFGNQAATGVYFYRLQADSFSCVRKMLLLR